MGVWVWSDIPDTHTPTHPYTHTLTHTRLPRLLDEPPVQPLVSVAGSGVKRGHVGPGEAVDARRRFHVLQRANDADGFQRREGGAACRGFLVGEEANRPVEHV